jgi:hypothetical protein
MPAEDLLHTLLFRAIFGVVGQYTRFYFFRIIGRKRTLRSLSNESKDDYRNMGKALTQDFLNAVVGLIVSFIIILIILAIVL